MIGKLENQLMHELQLKNPSQILGAVRVLNRETKTLGQFKQFIEKIKELILQCSPDSLKKTLSLKKTWKWVKRLVEEYLQLKQDMEKQSGISEVLDRLMRALRVRDVDSIPKAVCSSLSENERMLVMLNKVKRLLALPEEASLVDIDAYLTMRV